jgi:drug/metabolite transporter (DMT)-like permease
VYHGFTTIRRYKLTGKIWTPIQSSFYRRDGTLSAKKTGGMVARGFFALINFIVLFGTMKYAVASGTSPSIILSINSVTSFFCAIAFYVVYGEKLKVKHLIGMCLMVCCVVIIGLSKSISSTLLEVEDNEASDPNLGPYESQQSSVIIPICLALLYSVIATITCLISRMVLSRGYSHFQYVLDYLFIYGVCISILFV